MPQLRNLPPKAAVFDVFLAFADLYAPFADFSERLFRGPGPLSFEEREIIFSYCSDLNHCHYCFGGHSATAKLFGAAPDVFERLRAGIEDAPVAEKMKPLLRYVKKLTETPSRMAPADADAVYAAGWDDAAFHQAIALCSLANFMNRLVDGSGVEADPSKFAMRARNAMENGYQKPFLARLAARESAAR